MLKRYAKKSMRDLWSEESKFGFWLRVELAVLGARAEAGLISAFVPALVQAFAVIDVEEIEAIEAETQHDLIAFVRSVQNKVRAGIIAASEEQLLDLTKGDRTFASMGIESFADSVANEVHQDMTSYDTEDPALMLQMQKGMQLILQALEGLERELVVQAGRHKWTYLIARTHGKKAEVSTFGQLLRVFTEQVRRAIHRMKQCVQDDLSHGKISGAVGVYGDMDPNVEMLALISLGLKPARAATQILQRDRHAACMGTLTYAACVMEQVASSFWHLMQDDIEELEEARSEKQRGSSRMPHKKNPIIMERMKGLARVVRGNMHVALENIPTPLWRAVEQSSAERHIFPGTFALVHYMASMMTYHVKNLVVFPEQMLANLEKDQGVWAAGRVATVLMKRGVPYDVAYLHLQAASFTARKDRRPLREVLYESVISNDIQRTAPEVIGTGYDELFNHETYLERGVNWVFQGQ